MKIFAMIVAVAMVAGWPPATAEAGLGQFLKKGVQLITKGSGKAAREAAENGVKRATAEAVPAAARQAARQSASVTAKSVAPKVVVAGSTKLVRKATPLLDDLGVGGARALQKLSPAGTQKLAAVSADLAKSPHRKQWLEVIAQHGDNAVNWLWKHKGGVAVGVGASVVLLQPAEFLKTTGQVVEATIDATATQLVKPVLVSLADGVVAPVAKEIGTRAAASFPWRLLWLILFAGLAAWIGFRVLKRKLIA